MEFPKTVHTSLMFMATWILMIAAGNFGVNESYWTFLPVILTIEVITELVKLTGVKTNG